MLFRSWTYRWLLDPQKISPLVAMPSDLFTFQKDEQYGDHWIIKGEMPPAFNDYHGDHARLLVRYMFLMTPEEQRALLSASPSATTAGAPPATTNPSTTGQSGNAPSQPAGKVGRNQQRQNGKRGRTLARLQPNRASPSVPDGRVMAAHRVMGSSP